MRYLVIIFSLSLSLSYSQSMPLLYDFNSVEASAFYNPSAQVNDYGNKTYKYDYNLGLGINMEDLNLSYFVKSTLDKLFNRLTKDSKAFLNVSNSHNFSFLYEKNKHYKLKLNFGFYFNLESYVFNSKGLLDFFFKGNYNMKRGDLTKMDLYADAFLSNIYNIGIFYKSTGSNWSYGSRLKIYNNILSYNLRSNGYISHQSSENNLFKMKYNYTINLYQNSYDGYTDIFWSGNYGLGLDLGVSYVAKDYRIAFSIMDLNIQINQNISKYSGIGDIDYEGIDIYKDNQSNIYDRIRHILSTKNFVEESENESRNFYIPSKFFISGAYYLNNRINRDKSSIGIQANGIIVNENVISIFRTYYNLNFFKYYDIRIAYSLSRYNYSDIGFAFGFSDSFKSYFVSISNIIGLFKLKSASSFSISFGGSVSFDTFY